MYNIPTFTSCSVSAMQAAGLQLRNIGTLTNIADFLITKHLKQHPKFWGRLPNAAREQKLRPEGDVLAADYPSPGHNIHDDCCSTHTVWQLCTVTVCIRSTFTDCSAFYRQITPNMYCDFVQDANSSWHCSRMRSNYPRMVLPTQGLSNFEFSKIHTR
jgi:hypothetical protein